MEPLTGIEPVAFSLPRKCSTTELQRQRPSNDTPLTVPGPTTFVPSAANKIRLSPANLPPLGILARLNPEVAARPYILNRNEVAFTVFRAVHAEIVNLAYVALHLQTARGLMNAVTVEDYCAGSNTPGLYLDAMKRSRLVFRDEIIPMIFAERKKYAISRFDQSRGNFDFRDVTDEFGVS